jgi:hypothetical protein
VLEVTIGVRYVAYNSVSITNKEHSKVIDNVVINIGAAGSIISPVAVDFSQ